MTPVLTFVDLIFFFSVSFATANRDPHELRWAVMLARYADIEGDQFCLVGFRLTVSLAYVAE